MLDPQVLHDEILNIMIAGRDTTASTLTFVVYFVAMYPYIFARLRDEVLEQIGPRRRPTYDDIKEMKFLRAVINGMRKYKLYHCVTNVEFNSFRNAQVISSSVRPSMTSECLRIR